MPGQAGHDGRVKPGMTEKAEEMPDQVGHDETVKPNLRRHERPKRPSWPT